MNRKHCRAAYVYTNPLYFSTTRHSRNSKPCGLARIRHSSENEWLSSSARPKRHRPVYYQPVCSTRGPHDNEDNREKWFLGIKIWFRSKDNEKPKDHTEREADASGAKGSTNGASKDSPRSVSARGPEAGRDTNKENGDQSGRWPWQRDKEVANEVRSSTPEATERHGGERSKTVSGEKEGEKGKQLRLSLQERFENMTRIIIPGFAQEKQALKENALSEEEEEEDQEKQDAEPKPAELEEAQARESVRELYQPPRSRSDEEDESGKQEEKRWFRLPWKRKEDECDEGKQTVRKAVKGKKSKRSRPKPAVTAERIDTLEKIEVMAEPPRKQLSIPPKNGQGKDKGGQNDGARPGLERGREKESASVAKTKETETNTAVADMMTIAQRDVAEIRLIFGSETFFATETVSMPGGLIFRGNLRGEPKATIAKLEKKLCDRLGDKYTLCLAEGEEDNRPVVVVVPTARDKRPPAPRQKAVSVIVALMTICTCIGRGYFASALRANIRTAYGALPRRNVLDALFDLPSATSLTVAFCIMLIMVIAQGVQRTVAMRHKTRVALPFFLPSYQLGTFGAVVQIASPTPTRSALFDIALAGMVTMVALSCACLIVGLRMSTTFSAVVPVPMSVVSGSVIVGYLTQQVPDGKILVDYARSLIGLHPLAVVGANCLTIAALNLLPLRQLDGGRIIGALYGRKTAMMASRVTMLFLLLASSKTPYFIMYLAAMSFGPWSIDRPCKDEITEPNAVRTIVGYLFMVLMIGVLLPYPACKFFGTV